jgi:hypothetical protein
MTSGGKVLFMSFCDDPGKGGSAPPAAVFGAAAELASEKSGVFFAAGTTDGLTTTAGTGF